MSKRAIIVVDVQNDFITGSLSLSNCPANHNGAEIVPIINELLQRVPFSVVTISQDWHPKDHISFVDNQHIRTMKEMKDAKVFEEVTFVVEGEDRLQTLWPRHCVQDSKGAELHPALIVPQGAKIIKKGQDPDVDSYSAFWDNSRLRATELEAVLREADVEEVVICGIATDVCVKATALDALDLGFKVTLVSDACRGVEEYAIQRTLDEVKEKGGKVLLASDVI